MGLSEAVYEPFCAPERPLGRFRAHHCPEVMAQAPHQIEHPHQVVGRAGEQAQVIDLVTSRLEPGIERLQRQIDHRPDRAQRAGFRSGTPEFDS